MRVFFILEHCNKKTMSDKVKFDFSEEFENRNYKSCFARSVACNSQFKQTKSVDYQQIEQKSGDSTTDDAVRKPRVVNRPFTAESQEIVRLRKNSRNTVEDTRRFSCSNINSTRRTSICPSRIAEIPVENIVNQSKIETLQWQLKEIQKSREMHRAVMKQVVTFLEKAHHSLELLGSRMNRKNSVHRSKSEHQIITGNSQVFVDTSAVAHGNNRTMDESRYRDTTWNQSKDEEPSPEEIPPDKLAKESFRLLRTAQSLLNTREPDLVQLHDQPPENDVEFLAQLAEEFPTPEHKPQRATSFSLSPKLILPENETKISNAFNRKLSLQLTDVRRCSSTTTKTFRVDSARGSVAESDIELLTDTVVFGNRKGKSEKSNSPATGSISSVEDESGFSSMNSFQEVGLPLVNTTMPEEVSTKKALLRSMLHNNTDYSSLNFFLDSSLLDPTSSPNRNCERQVQEQKSNIDDIKLWQKPSASTPLHKRWYSSPVEEPAEPQSMKVLWV